MKVFEVITEHYRELLPDGGSVSTEIMKTVQYVTSQKDTLKSVVDHFTIHCEQYEKFLIGVKEVLTLVEHIPETKSPD